MMPSVARWRLMTVVGEIGKRAQNPEPAGEAPTIDVRDLRMRYGSVDVLKGIGFTAHRGEVITLLGPNGAGKTTTIEILEGFRMRSGGDGCGVAVVARPRQVAGARPALPPREVLPAVLHAGAAAAL